jgi:predicted enzyme related to lactoylglutathione lyase
MANNIPLIVYPVKNIDAAKKFYGAYLGTEAYIDGEYYVGYKLDDLEVGLDPNGSTVITYVDVDDMQASLTALQDAGGELVKDSTDVGGGRLIAQVKIEDAIVGLRQDSK